MQSVLLKYLKIFFVDISKKNLSSNLIRGRVELQNVSLNRVFLQDLLAINRLVISRASAEHVLVNAPITKIKSVPIQITISGLHVVLEEPKSFCEAGDRDPPGRLAPDLGEYSRNYFTKIFEMVTVRVHKLRLVLRLQEPPGAPGEERQFVELRINVAEAVAEACNSKGDVEDVSALMKKSASESKNSPSFKMHRTVRCIGVESSLREAGGSSEHLAAETRFCSPTDFSLRLTILRLKKDGRTESVSARVDAETIQFRFSPRCWLLALAFVESAQWCAGRPPTGPTPVSERQSRDERDEIRAAVAAAYRARGSVDSATFFLRDQEEIERNRSSFTRAPLQLFDFAVCVDFDCRILVFDWIAESGSGINVVINNLALQHTSEYEMENVVSGPATTSGKASNGVATASSDPPSFHAFGPCSVSPGKSCDFCRKPAPQALVVPGMSCKHCGFTVAHNECQSRAIQTRCAAPADQRTSAASEAQSTVSVRRSTTTTTTESYDLLTMTSALSMDMVCVRELKPPASSREPYLLSPLGGQDDSGHGPLVSVRSRVKITQPDVPARRRLRLKLTVGCRPLHLSLIKGRSRRLWRALSPRPLRPGPPALDPFDVRSIDFLSLSAHVAALKCTVQPDSELLDSAGALNACCRNVRVLMSTAASGTTADGPASSAPASPPGADSAAAGPRDRSLSEPGGDNWTVELPPISHGLVGTAGTLTSSSSSSTALVSSSPSASTPAPATTLAESTSADLVARARVDNVSLSWGLDRFLGPFAVEVGSVVTEWPSLGNLLLNWSDLQSLRWRAADWRVGGRVASIVAIDHLVVRLHEDTMMNLAMLLGPPPGPLAEYPAAGTSAQLRQLQSDLVGRLLRHWSVDGSVAGLRVDVLLANDRRCLDWAALRRVQQCASDPAVALAPPVGTAIPGSPSPDHDDYVVCAAVRCAFATVRAAGIMQPKEISVSLRSLRAELAPQGMGAAPYMVSVAPVQSTMLAEAARAASQSRNSVSGAPPSPARLATKATAVSWESRWDSGRLQHAIVSVHGHVISLAALGAVPAPPRPPPQQADGESPRTDLAAVLNGMRNWKAAIVNCSLQLFDTRIPLEFVEVDGEGPGVLPKPAFEVSFDHRSTEAVEERVREFFESKLKWSIDQANRERDEALAQLALSREEGDQLRQALVMTQESLAASSSEASGLASRLRRMEAAQAVAHSAPYGAADDQGDVRRLVEILSLQIGETQDEKSAIRAELFASVAREQSLEEELREARQQLAELTRRPSASSAAKPINRKQSL